MFTPVTRKPMSQVQTQPAIVRPSLATSAKKEAKVLSQAGISNESLNGLAAKKEARILSDGSRKLVLGHTSAKAVATGQRDAAPRKIANNLVTSTAVYGKSLANPPVQTLRTVAKEAEVTPVAAYREKDRVNGQARTLQNVLENGTTNALKESSRKVEDDMVGENAASQLEAKQVAEKAVSDKDKAEAKKDAGKESAEPEKDKIEAKEHINKENAEPEKKDDSGEDMGGDDGKKHEEKKLQEKKAPFAVGEHVKVLVQMMCTPFRR